MAQITRGEFAMMQEAYADSVAKRINRIKQLEYGIWELKGSPEAIQQLRKNVDSLRNEKDIQNKRKADLLSNNVDFAANNDTLAEYNLFIEKCICRFANGQLALKYDEDNVNRAICYMDSIKDKSLIDRYKNNAKVDKLLLRYAKDYEEFIGVISEAQKDIYRTNPLFQESYRDTFINRLKNLSYYKDYRSPDKNKWKDWGIPYLNGEIDKAIMLLERHSFDSDAPFIVDFSYLLLD